MIMDKSREILTLLKITLTICGSVIVPTSFAASSSAVILSTVDKSSLCGGRAGFSNTPFVSTAHSLTNLRSVSKSESFAFPSEHQLARMETTWKKIWCDVLNSINKLKRFHL